MAYEPKSGSAEWHGQNEASAIKRAAEIGGFVIFSAPIGPIGEKRWGYWSTPILWELREKYQEKVVWPCQIESERA